MTKNIINSQSYYKLDIIETPKNASELKTKTKRNSTVLKNEQAVSKK